MRCLVSAFTAVVICLAVASPAAADDAWSAPVDGCRIVLSFGAQYAGKTHSGVDLAADTGADVRSPADGIVTFAGAVPADGGGTCGAVTVELADGLRVSLLPLAEVFVSAGDRVSAADAVGTLAAAGDDSSGASHLHLGARRGSAYVDPTGFLPAAEAETPEPTGETVTDIAEPAAPPAPAASGVGQGTCVSVGAPVPADAAGVAPATVPLSPGAATGRMLASPAPSVGAMKKRDTHAIPEDSGVPAPSALAAPAVAGAGWAWSIPIAASAGATLPAVVAAITALIAVASPKLRAARVKAW